MITQEEQIIETQDKVDKTEPFTLATSTGDLKNGKLKISSLSAVKLKELAFHRVMKEEAEVSDLFNFQNWILPKEPLKNQVKIWKEELSE